MADRPIPPLASVGRRAAAILVDALVIYVIALAVANAIGATEGYTPTGIAFGTVGDVIFAVAVLAYFTLLESIVGATVGKLATGLRVRSASGGRVGMAQSLVRNILRVIDAIPFFVPFLLGAVVAWNTGRRQRLGDAVARSVVVEARGPAAAPST